MSSVDNIIKIAISNKQLLEFTYDNLNRIAEPHVYGIHDDKYEILVYQIRGQSSSGNLPNWRRMNLNKISDIHILEEHFQGSRPYPSGEHSSFDTVLAVVE